MTVVTDGSLALFQQAISYAWDALYKNDMATAMLHAKKAATIGPDLPETFHILGLLASRDGRSDIAVPLLEKALAAGLTKRRCRDIAEAYLVAGDAKSALACLQQAEDEFGCSAELCGLLAAVYVALGQYAAAANRAKEAIAFKPQLMAWEGTLSFCQLIQGDYEDGFETYTGRSQNLAAGSRCPALHFTTPGELWLKNEQGPGDTVFYARFAKPLADAGWRIHLQTDKRTKVLLRDTGIFASVKEAVNPPLHAFWLNMGDLPLAAMQTGAIATLPPLPFIPDQTRINKVKEKLAKIGPAPYVAVTWRAGARGPKQRAGLRMYDKSASPAGLGELLSKVNATIISIQRVPDNQEQAEFASALGRDFIDFSYYNDNLQDMLALLSVVDEYVAVPNTNVHLRESLNLTSQVLVNRPYQDWRWLAEGSKSPWYPNSMVYRQDMHQDWGSAFNEIGQLLRDKFGSFNAHGSAPLAISRTQLIQNEVDQILQKGWAAVNSNDIPTAIQAAQTAITRSAELGKGNENAEALHLLGWAAMRDFKYELAIGILKRAAEISELDGRIIGDYVRALSAGKRLQEAIDFASTAIGNRAVKNVSSIYFSRAAAFLQLNRLHDAISDYEACIKINPNRLDAQEYCGMARLKLGDTARGFRDYTARKVAGRDELINDWCCPILTKRDSGLHVLIKRDMGLGDELTFLRYLPWLTGAGIRADYWAGNKLAPMLVRLGYFNQVFSDADPAPDSTLYDLSFIVNDLPVAVEALGSPPVAPPLPLKPKPELVEKWRGWLKSIGDGPYIGINWRAGAANEAVARNRGKLAKAVDADAFAKTLSDVNATWISLQRNIVLDELKHFERTLNAPVYDAAALTDDLEDLLALLSLLDENIGVSNTNMHLRAGLGMRSRVLVQTPGGDWRWGHQGKKSEWFIESKVYRQHLSEDWSSALNELQADLISAYGNKAVGNKTGCNQNASLQPHSNILSKRLIWLTAGVIKNEGERKTSDLASTRYRVLAPALELEKSGWRSKFVNEAYAQAMGGWGCHMPQKGDTVIISKVFTDFSVKLAQDAKDRGATVIADFCDNFLARPQRGPLQHALLTIADKVTASTPAMAEAIRATGKNVDAIIADPVEFKRGEILFSPKKVLKLLWFGHAVNIDTLAQSLPALAKLAETTPLQLNVVTTLPNGQQDLDKITPAGLTATYIPWSVSATQSAIAACDMVIIPTLQSDNKNAKSPNRLLEPLWAGRMVVAGPLPAYLHFADSAWVGKDIVEGIQWCLANPQEVTKRIAQGQAHIEKHFTELAIGQQWDALLRLIQTKQIKSVATANRNSQIAPNLSLVQTQTVSNAKTHDVALLTMQQPTLPSIAIRLVEPLGMLEDYSVQIASGISNQKFCIDYQALLMHDTIIVQRDFPSVETLPLLKKLKALGKKLVYETDDAFHLIPETHSKAFHRAKAPAIFEFAKLADVITVSTQTLAEEFEPYGKVKLLPNRLSASFWNDALLSLAKQNRTKHSLEQLRIGVVGGANHRDDFALIQSAIQTIAAQRLSITWIAYGESAINLMASIPECAGFEMHATNYNYPGHPARLAQIALDIALVPLEDTAFNQCISNLKFLEFGFLGVPAVFSNTSSYNQTVVDGETGFLVNDITESWVKAIQTLLDNQVIRQKIGINAQKEVQTNWMLTSQNNGWKTLLDALT